MNLNIPAKSDIWKFAIPFDPINGIYPKEITREVAENLAKRMIIPEWYYKPS